MSFWASMNYAVSSVDQILDKERFTLEELLGASEIIQETQSLNGRLIAFLNKPETVSQLLEYIVVPAPPEKDEKGVLGKPPPSSDRAFRFPAMACEVFCCEARSIFETLLEHESLMQKLFSILDLPDTLDCVMAGYFSRVVYCLYAKRVDTHYEQSVEVVDYLQRHPEVISKLIRRIESTSVAEVLLRFLGADENSATPIPPAKLLWMLETNYLEELVDQLDPACSLDAQHNAAYILAGIARGNFSPLVMHLTQRSHIIPKIFQFAFKDIELQQRETSPIWKPSGTFNKIAPLHRRRPALDVCISLLDGSERNWNANDDSGENLSPLASMNNSAECRQLALEEMRSHMEDLKGLLFGMGLDLSETRIPTPYGILKPPLSITRLKAVELVSIIVLIQDPQCCQGLWQHSILIQLQQLFLDYPFHNLLHRQVFGIFSLILQSDSPELLQHLLEECRLVDWLIKAPKEVPLEGSEKTIRAGYLGHITHLANHLAGLAHKQQIAEAMAACPGWGDWAEETLRSRNETEDTTRWSCGLPAFVAAPSSSENDRDEEPVTFTDIDEIDSQNMAHLNSDRYQDSRLPTLLEWGMQMGQSPPTFRSIDLDDGLKASSSSSSSDSDSDIPLRPSLNSLLRSTTILSDSSEDEDTVVVDSATRYLPTDAGFTDFDDVGGLHSGSPPNASRRDTWPASNALNMVDVSLSDDAPNSMDESRDDSAEPSGETWNAFSDPADPTDIDNAGWATFPPQGDTEPAAQSRQDHDSTLPHAQTAETPSMIDSAAHKKEESIGPSPTKPVEIRSSKLEEKSEFSSFNFWRQPVMHLDDDF